MQAESQAFAVLFIRLNYVENISRFPYHIRLRTFIFTLNLLRCGNPFDFLSRRVARLSHSCFVCSPPTAEFQLSGTLQMESTCFLVTLSNRSRAFVDLTSSRKCRFSRQGFTLWFCSLQSFDLLFPLRAARKARSYPRSHPPMTASCRLSSGASVPCPLAVTSAPTSAWRQRRSAPPSRGARRARALAWRLWPGGYSRPGSLPAGGSERRAEDPHVAKVGVRWWKR